MTQPWTRHERRHALRDRKDDLYETPPEATRALLAVEPLPKVIWERPHTAPTHLLRVDWKTAGAAA